MTEEYRNPNDKGILPGCISWLPGLVQDSHDPSVRSAEFIPPAPSLSTP